YPWPENRRRNWSRIVRETWSSSSQTTARARRDGKEAWPQPSTDPRIDRDRTGPDLDERPVSIQHVTEPGDCCGRIVHVTAVALTRAVSRKLGTTNRVKRVS